MQNPGPQRPSVEKVNVGTTWQPAALTVHYTPATGRIHVANGTLIGKEVKMTVKSDTGAVYTITRKHGGGYQGNSAFTWVQRFQ